MTKQEQIEEIHASLVNGQRQQMVKQIDRQCLYDFWAEYDEYLINLYPHTEAQHKYFLDAVVSYHRIKNR